VLGQPIQSYAACRRQIQSQAACAASKYVTLLIDRPVSAWPVMFDFNTMGVVMPNLMQNEKAHTQNKIAQTHTKQNKG